MRRVTEFRAGLPGHPEPLPTTKVDAQPFVLVCPLSLFPLHFSLTPGENCPQLSAVSTQEEIPQGNQSEILNIPQAAHQATGAHTYRSSSMMLSRQKSPDISGKSSPGVAAGEPETPMATGKQT